LKNNKKISWKWFVFQLKKAARLYNQDIKELEKYGEDLREHYEKAKVTHKKVKESDQSTSVRSGPKLHA